MHRDSLKDFLIFSQQLAKEPYGNRWYIKDQIVDLIANCATGGGKTVSALALIRELGTPTLVIVHTNRLKEQWRGVPGEKSGMRFFFGDNFADNYV